jgi:hypothetical protein
MTVAQILIDKAKKMCNGSRRELGRRLNEDPAFLGRVERGETPMPPGLAARLAEVSGEDPRESVLAAVIEGERDADSRQTLAKLLRVSSGATHALAIGAIGLVSAIGGDAHAQDMKMGKCADGSDMAVRNGEPVCREVKRERALKAMAPASGASSTQGAGWRKR